LEAALQYIPCCVLVKKDFITIKSSILKLANNIFSAIECITESMSDFYNIGARIIGSFIGLTLSTKASLTGKCNEMYTSSSEYVIINSEPEIFSFVEEILMLRVFDSSLNAVSDWKSTRYDWKILSNACRVGNHDVKELIISKILSSLEKAIQSSSSMDSNASCTVAMIISHIMQEGGNGSCKAFHSLSSPQKTYIDIIDALTGLYARDHALQNRLSNSVYTRDLNDKSPSYNAIKFAYSVLTHLIPAFHQDVSLTNQKMIVDSARQILPLSCESNYVKICVILPILSAILNKNITNIHEFQSESLVAMAPYLLELAFTRNHPTVKTPSLHSTRVAASSCIFSIGANFQTNTCISLRLLRDIVCPLVTRCTKKIIGGNMKFDFSDFQDTMKLCALLVSKYYNDKQKACLFLLVKPCIIVFSIGFGFPWKVFFKNRR